MTSSGEPGARAAGPAFWAVLLLSLVVLFVPRAPSPPPVPEFDKLVHSMLFLLLAATTRWRFGARLGLVAAVAGYGVLSELVQAALLPQRSGDPLDALADAAGALLGWVLASAVLRRRERRSG